MRWPVSAVPPGLGRASRVGEVVWLADEPTLLLPDGNEMPLRLTAVLLEQDGRWCFVQFHLSIGVSNEEVVGEELPT